jgi:hypothetical protein
MNETKTSWGFNNKYYIFKRQIDIKYKSQEGFCDLSIDRRPCQGPTS